MRYRPIIPHAAIKERWLRRYKIVMKRLQLDDKNYIEEFTNQGCKENSSLVCNPEITNFNLSKTKSSLNHDDDKSSTAKTLTHDPTI